MSASKPTLRPPPTLDALALQQEAAARLLKLDEWTSEPLEPPAPSVGPQTAPAHTAPAVQAPAAPAPKPWEAVSEDARHTYHIVCSERLFQKMDYIWKRQGYASMRAWVLETLNAQADSTLKKME